MLNRILKRILLTLTPTLVTIVGVFVYLLFAPLHPEKDRYVRLRERRAQKHGLTYVDEAFFGNYRQSLALSDALYGNKNTDLPASDFHEYSPVNALEYIDSVAVNTRAIFVNEEHDHSRQRAFTILLLHKLWRAGFRYFAAEALGYGDPELQQRKYPLAGLSGTYINDPIYGDMIRTALQLGYILVPYEARDPDAGWNREEQQARNLIKQVFGRDQHARLLVHAGYGHITDGQRSPMMGRHFKQLSGIDPLTIDQTMYTERSDTVYEKPEYRSATARGLVKQSVFLRNKRDVFFTGGYPVDLVLFHPRSTFVNGRPDWVTMGGNRKPLIFDAKSVSLPPPFLVQAFVQNEVPVRRYLVTEFLPVPLDQIEIQDVSAKQAIYVYPGKYIVTIVNSKGVTVQRTALEMR